MDKALGLQENINVSEYKQGIKEKIRPYKGLEGAELAEARTGINKVFKEYDDQRKALTKSLTGYIKGLMEPLIELKKGADEAYEEVERKRKRQKLIEIMKYFKGNYAQYIPQWDLLNDERWLNKTHDSWAVEIDAKIAKIESDLKVAEKLGLSQSVYLEHLDLDRLIEEKENIIDAEVTSGTLEQPLDAVDSSDGVRRYTFDVVVTPDKKKALNAFLEANGYVYTERND